MTAQEAPRLPGVIVSLSPSLLEKVREKPYARDLFTVLYAVVIALQAGEWHRHRGVAREGPRRRIGRKVT